MSPVNEELEFSVRQELKRTDTSERAHQKSALVAAGINTIEEVAQRLQLLGWVWAPTQLREIADGLKAEKGRTW
jgi:hypothetical protein